MTAVLQAAIEDELKGIQPVLEAACRLRCRSWLPSLTAARLSERRPALHRLLLQPAPAVAVSDWRQVAALAVCVAMP